MYRSLRTFGRCPMMFSVWRLHQQILDCILKSAKNDETASTSLQRHDSIDWQTENVTREPNTITEHADGLRATVAREEGADECNIALFIKETSILPRLERQIAILECYQALRKNLQTCFINLRSSTLHPRFTSSIGVSYTRSVSIDIDNRISVLDVKLGA